MCGFPLSQAAPVPSPVSPPPSQPPTPRPPKSSSSPTPSSIPTPPPQQASFAPQKPEAYHSSPQGFIPPTTPRTKPRLPIGRALIGLIILISITLIGFFGWQWWENRPATTSPLAEVEPCIPADLTDEYQLSNSHGLSGAFAQNTYFANGEEYSVEDNSTLTVPKDITLLIEPGARVRFGEGAKLVIQGTLLACGQDNRRILFTADASSGRPGYWAGIEFDNADSDSVIGHATFEFAGREGHAPIWLQDTDLHIEDVRFDSNQWYALSFNPDSFPRIRSPFTVENGPQGWEVRGGKMNKDQTWDSEQPFIVKGGLEVVEDAKLTLPSGIWVKFQPNSALRISGEMEANGTASNPIVFTSVNEQGDDTAPDPGAGDWGGLQFFGRDGRSQLAYVEIRYAGDTAIQSGCLYLQDAAPSFNNLTISDCGGFALSTDILSEPSFENLNLPEIKATQAWELRESTLDGTVKRSFAGISVAGSKTLLNPIVTGWVGIAESATLAVEPGVKFLFRGGERAGLWADGKLQLNGTQKDPILLTSWQDQTSGGEGGAASGDWGGLHLKGSQADETTLSFVTIRYGGQGNTNCLRLTNAAPTLNHLTIENCTGYPVSSDAASEPVVEALELKQNAQGNLWEIRESSLEERSEWVWTNLLAADDTPIIRLVTGLITIKPDATLTLEPGLILKFTGNAGLWAQGSLIANGTAAQPILMTSWRDPEGGGAESGAQPGDWAGVALDGGQTLKKLAYVEIRYAGIPNRGVSCLGLNEAAATLENVSIRHCAYYPISSDMVSDPKVTGLVLEDNQPADEWAMRKSTLPRGATRTWEPVPTSSGGQIIRTALDWLSVEEGAQLKINPGVVIKFQQNAGLWVGGSLNIEGSETQRVIFTSWRDPEFSREGGVQAGDWAGLAMEHAQGNSEIKYLEVRYAGANRNPRGAITLLGTSPTLSNIVLQDSAWYPLSLDLESNPKLERATFKNNTPANAVEIRASDLTTSGEHVLGTWTDAAGQPLIRVVTGQLNIGENATLRLTSNVVVKFDTNGKFVINGGLLMADAVLTSLHDDEYGGDTDGNAQGEPSWQGIELRSRKLIHLENTLIRFAQTGIWMENAAPQLVGVKIEDSWVSALNGDLLSTPEISGLSLSRNALNGLLLRGTTLPEGETRWQILNPDEPLVRVVQETLTVGTNARLIIDPGVIVKFAPETGLIVEGQMQAGQRNNTPVIFTTLADDEFGGDTDSTFQDTRRGGWLGLTVNPNNTNASLSLFSVRIRFATVGLLLTNLENWEYADLTIENSQAFGLSCDETFPFDPTNEEISLLNNGIPTESCPTPDR